MPNANDDVFEAVKEVILSQLTSVKEDQIVESARFIEELGADSLDVVELVMIFEEKFSLEIPEESANKILTAKDAVDFIRKAKQTN